MFNNKSQSNVGIISLVIGSIVSGTILISTFKPLTDASSTLSSTMNASTINGVANLSTLPNITVWFFYFIIVIGGIIGVMALIKK